MESGEFMLSFLFLWPGHVSLSVNWLLFLTQWVVEVCWLSIVWPPRSYNKALAVVCEWRVCRIWYIKFVFFVIFELCLPKFKLNYNFIYVLDLLWQEINFALYSWQPAAVIGCSISRCALQMDWHQQTVFQLRCTCNFELTASCHHPWLSL